MGSNKHYIADTGEPLKGAGEKSAAGLSMVLVALAIGFVAGLAVWAVFYASSALTELLWGTGYSALAACLEGAGIPSWWIPIAFCLLGGTIIGLWSLKMGGAPAPLAHVLASVKKTGSYRLENLLASIVGFLLPLVFGGAIGPEAGIAGIIAAACTRIGEALKRAGIRVKGLTDVTISAALSAVFVTPFAGIIATAEGALAGADEPADGTAEPADSATRNLTFRRSVKLVLYTASALGAVGAVAAFTALFGSEGGLPRFEGVTPQDVRLLWGIPCLVAGYLGALLFHTGEKCFGLLSAKMGEHPVLKPVIAGLVLGLLALPLPYVLFPGEAQAFALMDEWNTLGVVVLAATGLCKCLATPLCLNFGWKGGHFFPIIFAGIALGYAVAAVSGVDPMFCIAITCATLVAGVQRKPFMALALLLLCFPVSSVVWLGIACLIGAALPLPIALRTSSAK